MKNLYFLLKKFIRQYILPLPEKQYIPLKKRKVMLSKAYKAAMGEPLDWKHLESFTEKIQWMKLYYTHPDLTRCVDKYEFKGYIHEHLGDGYTASLITVWNNADEVSIRDIPVNKFVLKSTLQSDGKYIILVSDKSKLDIEKAEKEIKENWFNTKNLLTNSFCSAYYGAKPRVIVEEYIEEFANMANDYKLFCFHGKPAYFYVAEDHFKNGENSTDYPITFYDLDWNMMDVRYGEHKTNSHVAKPYHIDEMIQTAKKLSKEFPFVRVDYFDTADKLYLAELTFYPGGGFTAYHPESFNIKMGNMLTLPKNE